MIALSLLAAPAFAQTANPLSTWLRDAYTNNHNNILRSAEKMPEEFYGLRPGAQQEVRTFGQQLGHVANFNFLWCSQAKGEKNPNAGTNLEKLTTKAEFIKAAQRCVCVLRCRVCRADGRLRRGDDRHHAGERPANA